MAVKKRCNFCRKYLRPDGTCQNPDCPRYVPEDTTNSADDQNDATENNEEE